MCELKNSQIKFMSSCIVFKEKNPAKSIKMCLINPFSASKYAVLFALAQHLKVYFACV